MPAPTSTSTPSATHVYVRRMGKIGENCATIVSYRFHVNDGGSRYMVQTPLALREECAIELTPGLEICGIELYDQIIYVYPRDAHYPIDNNGFCPGAMDMVEKTIHLLIGAEQ